MPARGPRRWLRPILLKGNLLDSLFMGLAPGNFHMTSALDAHRQEAQRDSGDPIGITARALTGGLFGLQSDLVRGTLTIRPGFPREWSQASLKHADLDFIWRREGPVDTYELSSRLPKSVPLALVLPARSIRLPKVSSGSASFDPAAVGAPALVVTLPAAPSWKVAVEWSGDAPAALPTHRTYSAGQTLALPPGVALAQIDDPQHSLAGGRVAVPGYSAGQPDGARPHRRCQHRRRQGTTLAEKPRDLVAHRAGLPSGRFP